MKIELHKIKIRDLIDGYKNHPVDGVVGYGGKLNIRPKFQREFVYKDKQRNAVVDTIRKGFPLNTMYWTVNVDEDGNETYEVLDGQQRTISLADYVGQEVDGKRQSAFAVNFDGNDQYFHNVEASDSEAARAFLDYELQVYFCEGTDKEKLDWFQVINIAGEKLSDQELRNAVYTGPWLSDAKSFFSKNNGAAQNLGKKYLSGDFNRQAYLETAIKWINKGDITGYMAQHQNDTSAEPLKDHFRKVIAWIEKTFPKYRKEMKGIEWGVLYAEHGNKNLDAFKLEEQIATLMKDEDVDNKKGIYIYVLTGKESALNLRSFSDNEKREAYERQQGVCPQCGPTEHYKEDEMEADHITPWSRGGKTEPDNCQMLCKDHNRRKSAI